ncbi:MAG: hypothetical protein KJS77_09895 [Planctomycetes bacterium]|nr:hypothetical protein [Planctomycetota bacterium]
MTAPRPRRLARACLGLLAAVVAPAAQAEPVMLRYQFHPDDRMSMRVEHRALTETTMSETTQAVETMTDSTKTWTVVGVDAAGTATLEQSVDDVTMTSRTSDRGEIRWSSGSGAEPPPGYELVPHSLGVPLVRMTVAADGRVLDRRELRPCPPAATGDLVVVPLPDEPVEAGFEWTIPQEVVVEVPNGPRKAVRTRLRYRLDSIKDGVATIAVDTTVLTPVDDPRLEARLLERIWDGTIRFDIDRGRVVGRQTSIDRRVVGFGGPQSSVRYKASLAETPVEE